MFIRTLALFAIVFSFGQVAVAAECPYLNQVQCHISSISSYGDIDISQVTTRDGVTIYQFRYQKIPPTVYVADGNVYPLRNGDGKFYTATCNSGTLTLISMFPDRKVYPQGANGVKGYPPNFDTYIKGRFIIQAHNDGHIDITSDFLLPRRRKTPQAKGSCSRN